MESLTMDGDSMSDITEYLPWVVVGVVSFCVLLCGVGFVRSRKQRKRVASEEAAEVSPTAADEDGDAGGELEEKGGQHAESKPTASDQAPTAAPSGPADDAVDPIVDAPAPDPTIASPAGPTAKYDSPDLSPHSRHVFTVKLERQEQEIRRLTSKLEAGVASIQKGHRDDGA
jgi:hypothetical protein